MANDRNTLVNLRTIKLVCIAALLGMHY